MTDTGHVTAFKKEDKVVASALGVAAAAVVAALLYGLYLVMPMLVSLAKNTIVFFGLMAILVLMVLAAAQVWAERDVFLYKWKLFARNLRKAIVREDPIGVLSTAIQRFEARLEQIDARIAEAIGAKNTQDKGIAKAERQANEEEAKAGAAQRLGRSDREIGLHAMNAKRWRDAADSMRPMAELMANMQTSLEGARDLARTRLDDLINQKQVMAIRLETAQSGKKAVKSLKLFFGSSSDSDMADMAFDEIERQTSEAEAEIDQFMRVMDPMLKSADLSKQAETMAAMQRFSTFSKHALPAAAEVLALPDPVPSSTAIPVSR